MASKPPAAEEILANYHAKTYENGIGDANPSVKGQAVTIEDIATYNRLKQIVGETHATKNTQMLEHLTHPLECIPCRDYYRHNHQ